MKHAIAAAVALGVTVTATPLMAQAEMSAGDFLAKAEKLQAQGPMALFSSDLSVLKAEGKRAAQLYKADLLKQKQAGVAPHSCPPEKIAMNSDEILGYLKGLSPAQKKQSYRSAFYGLMKQKFPCK